VTDHALAHLPGQTLLGAVQAHLHARALDRELACGVATWRSSRHATRSLQLTSRRRRDGLAATLEDTLRTARRARIGSLFTAVISPCRGSVLGCSGQLSDLVVSLRGPEPVHAEGIARLQELLCNGAGPLYTPNRLGDLQRALHEIQRCLVVSS
jgi:hypothetical protein